MKTMSKLNVLIATAVMSISSAAFAASGSTWEFWTGSMGSLDFISTGGTSTTQINLISPGQRIAPSLGYNLGEGFEVLLTPMFQSTSNTSTTTTFLITGGLAYNFMGEWDDAMYLKAQAGLISISAASSASGFAWNASLGKRFKIVDHVSWAPEFSYSSLGITSTAATAVSASTFSIVPLQITAQM